MKFVFTFNCYWAHKPPFQLSISNNKKVSYVRMRFFRHPVWIYWNSLLHTISKIAATPVRKAPCRVFIRLCTVMWSLQQHFRQFLSHKIYVSTGDLPSYLTRFQWDIAKYPTKQSLRNIADIISKQVGQIDADLKTKSTAYNNLKGSLQNLEKKQT